MHWPEPDLLSLLSVNMVAASVSVRLLLKVCLLLHFISTMISDSLLTYYIYFGFLFVWEPYSDSLFYIDWVKLLLEFLYSNWHQICANAGEQVNPSCKGTSIRFHCFSPVPCLDGQRGNNKGSWRWLRILWLPHWGRKVCVMSNNLLLPVFSRCQLLGCLMATN